MERELTVSYRKLEELTPYLRNARTHTDAQVRQIVQSMKTFGWTNPVLIDEVGQIIAGHGRLRAAAKLKLKQVPCIVLTGLTEEEKRAYVIADNKLAANAGWDLALLASELKGLEVAGFQISLTGFSNSELADLIGAESPVRQGLTDDARLLELDPRFVDVIVRRWEAFTGKPGKHAESGQSFADVSVARLPAPPTKSPPESPNEAAA